MYRHVVAYFFYFYDGIYYNFEETARASADCCCPVGSVFEDPVVSGYMLH